MTLLLVAAGCSSSPAKNDAEAVKSFKGGPMPKDFMKNMNSAQDAAKKAAEDAAKKNGG